MKFLNVLLFAVSAVVVCGQVQAPTGAGIAVTQPALGAAWQAGTTCKISWTINDSSATVLNAIELRKGVSTNLAMVYQVATNVPIGPGEYLWDIPADTASDGSYVLVLKSNKGDTYSPYFTILAVDPNAPVNRTTTAVSVPKPSETSTLQQSSSPVIGMNRWVFLAGSIAFSFLSIPVDYISC